ncbi:MoaD/ThiS family protein [Gordonia neofelifaecis]|uniref:ThiamineS protein n=1 Tax=Gordonia neofelifaecis NRRL B-59395 TaxID=644548 RepID=F1YJ97_9ACTN|nr:MoaD/ThiS family protein [Gordonia neofelifaecis]EGD55130.1 thiamineS protein [Gordonia neofelifaecis NRRL B-59395]
MIIRYFAGAAEAAGRKEQTVDGELTVGDLKELLSGALGPEFARVLTCCSVLVDGTRATDETFAGSGATVDVLPPFAGG